MNQISLVNKEQTILNSACARLEKATKEAEAVRSVADQLRAKAEAHGHEARGYFRSILELKGINPDAYQLNWNGEKATITEMQSEVKENPVELPKGKT